MNARAIGAYDSIDLTQNCWELVIALSDTAVM